MNQENPIGMNGLAFVEFASPKPEDLESLFVHFGFCRRGQHKQKPITLWEQQAIHFLLNQASEGAAYDFQAAHGPSLCAMGWRVHNPEQAWEISIQRGATPAKKQDHGYPAIMGIGDALIYFVSDQEPFYKNDYNLEEVTGSSLELVHIDHLTNNVPKGEMEKWVQFYQNIFGFEETRYFDIRGEKTGLLSKVMRSPCKKIMIPINEPTEGKSQIQEFLDEYNGSGVQHLALSSSNILQSVQGLSQQGVEFLDIPQTYYEALPKRVPNIVEPLERLSELQILADGDDDGYLLQIFTKTIIGPIFFEIIQRKNHGGFGEGNFQALFDAIERDQQLRGYLK